jgi:hypothetical protein
MKKKINKQASPEVLQALLIELRALVAETKEKIQAAKRKRGPRKPREVKHVPQKFTQAVMRTEIPKRKLKPLSLRIIP